jgi:hypothetical protein
VPARSVSGAGGKAECLEIKVTGAREIEKILKELGPTAANRIARSALNRSATPIVRRAKELVPVATGELKRATTRRQRRGADKQEILIGIEGRQAGGAFRGVWIETFVDEQVKLCSPGCPRHRAARQRHRRSLQLYIDAFHISHVQRSDGWSGDISRQVPRLPGDP